MWNSLTETSSIATHILAIITTIPSLFGLALLIITCTVIIVLVHKRRTKQGTQVTNNATSLGIQAELENVLYSQKLVTTTENVAYETNVAIAPDRQVGDNVAYIRIVNDDPSGPAYVQDSLSSDDSEIYYY